MVAQQVPSTTLNAPQRGFVSRSDKRVNGEYRTRVGVTQIATSTLTAGFDGARDLGFFYSGLMAYGPDAANVAAWLVLVNAALAGVATVSHNAGVVTVTSLDYAAHVLSPFNPASPDLELSAFTVTRDAVGVPTIGPGMGVVWKDRALRTVQAPLPGSTLLDFVGVVDRMSILADTLAVAFGASAGLLVNGQRLLLHRDCTAHIAAAPSVGITAGNPMFLGRLPSEAGLWYPADDGGNTRLEIPNAQWLATVTAPADGSYGVQAAFG